MGEGVDVTNAVIDVVKTADWVLWRIDSAIISITSLGKSVSLGRVEDLEGVSCLVDWHAEHCSHEHAVSHQKTHDDSPEHGMWSLDQCVWELSGGKDHKCQEGNENGVPSILKDIRAVMDWILHVLFS